MTAGREPQARAEAPRPILWAYALVFGLLLTNLIFLGVASTRPSFDPLISLSAARLEKATAEARVGGASVVLIGDSKMMYGLLDDSAFGARLSEKAGADVSVVRLLSYGGAITQLEPLLDLAITVRPDLVVLQRDLYSKELTLSATLKKRFQASKTLGVNSIFGLLSRAELIETMAREIDLAAGPCGRLSVSAPPEEIVRLLRRNIRFDDSGPSARLAASFLEKAKLAGARIALTQFPQMPAALTEAPPAPAAGPPAGMAHADLAPPMAFDAAWFCDFNHMNDRGRRVYSEWLASELAKLLSRGAT